MFDPVDAVISFQLRDYLKARLSAFAHHLSNDTSARVDPRSILNKFNKEVSSRIPFYTGLTPDTFDNIPLVSKSDLQKNPHLFIATDIEQAWYKDTSGTTGAPVRVFYSAEFLFEQRFLDIEKILLLRSFDPAAAGVCCVQLTDTASAQPSVFASPLDPRCVLATLNIADPRWIDQVAKLRPRFVSSRPEIFAQIGEELAKVPLPLEALVSAGSALTFERRTQIETTLGAKCVDVYALSEFGMVAAECSHGALHVDATSVFAEVIGEDQQVLPHGCEGELVLSTLANSAQPLLRYRTGDQGALTEEACSCGKSGPILRLTGGRLVPTFLFGSGAAITPTCFNNLALLWALEDYQVIQKGPDCVEVLLEPSASTPADVIRKVSDHVRSLLPHEIRVEVRLVSFPAAMKRQRYVVRPDVVGN